MGLRSPETQVPRSHVAQDRPSRSSLAETASLRALTWTCCFLCKASRSPQPGLDGLPLDTAEQEALESLWRGLTGKAGDTSLRGPVACCQPQSLPPLTVQGSEASLSRAWHTGVWVRAALPGPQCHSLLPRASLPLAPQAAGLSGSPLVLWGARAWLRPAQLPATANVALVAWKDPGPSRILSDLLRGWHIIWGLGYK